MHSNLLKLLFASVAAVGSVSAALVTSAESSVSSYDAIIVGAGVAGNVVAERLAGSGAKTLLLERGPASTAKSGGTHFMPFNDTVTIFDVPAFAFSIVLADPNAYYRDTPHTTGYLFGGGGLMWVPPAEHDINDNWPTGWEYDDIKQAYERVESLNPGTTMPSGNGERYDYEPGAFGLFSDLLGNEGWTHVDAIEQPNEKHLVYSYPPQNVAAGEGIRAGPPHVYFSLALENENFSHQLNANVTRVIRDGGLVTGVEVENEDGSRSNISLNEGGKVILTAGVFGTSRILFNSGIGPIEQIETVENGTTGVTLPDRKQWIELPVGERIRDHPIVTLLVDTSSSDFTFFNNSALYFGTPDSKDIELYNTEASGVIAQSQQRILPWTSVTGSDNRTRHIQLTIAGQQEGQLSVKVYLTHGLTSTGTIAIEANGTMTWAQEPWYNTEGDISAAVAFVDEFRGYLEGSRTLELTASQRNLTSRELVLGGYGTGLHFAGSAVIGEVNDGGSVVDLDTKVWGTQNLFVADASFHADVPTGNIQAQVAIMAEHAAGKIISCRV
ncbi:GMC oxidoreductase [Zasmidium cellare ATCC 36951]|uniref:GMC oxidoreductase n=1 Tax=Zasmidium cellare ATCC 36951 TaxID=1080233 RepID=A0A6A6D4B1_ZASCE|nr:GMC oxidoreductase [Zasmidium cellare ATCC 36951]KAF2173258.1 GMC oxidoreductase [Zasmidium cellare ATCC 36951]